MPKNSGSRIFCGRCGGPAVLRIVHPRKDSIAMGQGYWYECVNEKLKTSCGIAGPYMASPAAAALAWGEMTAWILKGKLK